MKIYTSKIITITLSLLILQQISFAAASLRYVGQNDCGTPVECYIKAIDLLNQDRKDMHNLKDTLEAELDKRTKETEANLNKKFEEKEKEWTEKQKQMEEALNNKTKEFEKVVADLKAEVQEYQKYIAKNNNMYQEAEIHQDIIEALEKSVITKVGNPVGWDENSYRASLWNGRKMLRIGTGAQSNGNGLEVNVPQGYDTLWMRCVNDAWGVFRFAFTDGDKEELGKFSCGYRSLNNFSPDGASPDSFNNVHIWMPIPLERSGKLIIYSDINGTAFISGIAFGKNLWNHAANSAISYVWKLNGGSDLTYENWNSDQLGHIIGGKPNKLMVPVISNGKDKVLYIVEHNNNWDGTYHLTVKVNQTFIQRFKTSYSNPFATHFNSKLYSRYMATTIPKEIIPAKAKFIEVEIDMSLQNSNINFRELGTHDLN